MITTRTSIENDPHELERLQHENARLRKALSLRGRLEDLVIENARLKQALHTYGRHTHPNCHDLVKGGCKGERHGCLCGLDEANKKTSDD